MAKKVSKKTRIKSKSSSVSSNEKLDIVLQSLLNLERQTRDLISKVDTLIMNINYHNTPKPLEYPPLRPIDNDAAPRIICNIGSGLSK
jgi:hypothetical protein